MVGVGGVCIACASSKRIGWVFLAPPAFLLGFVFIAGAPMLGSIGGAILLFGTWAVGGVAVVLIGLWWSNREWRRTDAAPELNDRSR